MSEDARLDKTDVVLASGEYAFTEDRSRAGGAPSARRWLDSRLSLGVGRSRRRRRSGRLRGVRSAASPNSTGGLHLRARRALLRNPRV